MSIFDTSLWIKRQPPVTHYIMVVSYYLNKVMELEDNMPHIRDNLQVLGIKRFSEYTRIVGIKKVTITHAKDECYGCMSPRDLIAHFVLTKHIDTAAYVVKKSRKAGPTNAAYFTIQDFEDVMGIQ